jgi:Fe-S-cluster-containing dehydrogenase component
MVIDTLRCVGCAACLVACEVENDVPEGYCRDWIAEETRGVFPHLVQEIRSERCNHCSDPPCVPPCPTGASHVEEGGIVLVKHDLCTGCKACIAGCPYDSRYVHPRGYVDKCTFCQHRLREGRLPACVSACPTFAMSFGDLDDPNGELTRLLASGRTTKVLNPATGARPNVYFLL